MISGDLKIHLFRLLLSLLLYYCNATFIVISFTERGASVITPYLITFYSPRISMCFKCSFVTNAILLLLCARMEIVQGRHFLQSRGFPSSTHLMVQASLMHVPIHSACNLVCFIVINSCAMFACNAYCKC